MKSEICHIQTKDAISKVAQTWQFEDVEMSQQLAAGDPFVTITGAKVKNCRPKCGGKMENISTKRCMSALSVRQ